MITYPLDLERSFEHRWAARMARDWPLRSSSRGTNTCTCGHVITAPAKSSYAPSGVVVNAWHCSACGRQWDAIADTGRRSWKPGLNK